MGFSSSHRRQPPFAPDIAAEVRSTSNDAEYRERKFQRYLACGAVLVLDVDPEARSIVAIAPEGRRIYRSGARFKHPATPWLDFDVDEAFAGIEYFD